MTTRKGRLSDECFIIKFEEVGILNGGKLGTHRTMELRKEKEKQKSKSEEKMVGFSSTSLFPARKREAVNMVETDGR